MKKYLATGLIVVLPLSVTIIFIVYVINLLTNPFLKITIDLFRQFDQPIFNSPLFLTLFAKIATFFLVLLAILLLGFFSQKLFFENLFNVCSKHLSKLPFFGPIYAFTKKIIETIFSKEMQKIFKVPLQTPFLDPRAKAIAFESKVAKEIEKKLKEKTSTVFIPTTPHVITGFLLLLPQKSIKRLNLSGEDALKFILSLGTCHKKKNESDIFSSQ